MCTCAVNVNRPKSFLDAAQREKMREREARESGLMFSRDRLIEMIPVSSHKVNMYAPTTKMVQGRYKHIAAVLGTSLVLCMSRLFVVTLYLIFCTKHSRPYLYSGCGLRGLIWMVTLLREERPVNREPSRLQEKAQFWHNYFLANQGTCRLINFVYCDGVYKYK